MTREDRARETLMRGVILCLPVYLQNFIVSRMLAFADAEAAAMRERAAVAARDALVRHEWPPQDGDVQCDEVLAAIRALPATGEVGR